MHTYTPIARSSLWRETMRTTACLGSCWMNLHQAAISNGINDLHLANQMNSRGFNRPAVWGAAWSNNSVETHSHLYSLSSRYQRLQARLMASSLMSQSLNPSSQGQSSLASVSSTDQSKFSTALAQPGETSAKTTTNTSTSSMDLTASALFDSSWRRIIAKARAENWTISAPREIVWLNGAPGSGKGANTPFIIRTRPVQTKIVEMSSLVRSLPSAKAIIESGGLVPDALILDILLESVLTPPSFKASTGLDSANAAADTSMDITTDGGAVKPGDSYGVLVDGFPRTPLQVDCVKLLYEKLYQMYSSNSALDFPRPRFRVVVLYVDEETSVSRQLRRGKEAEKRSMRAMDAGVLSNGDFESSNGNSISSITYQEKDVIPEYMRPRSTDRDEEMAKRRYAIFKEHYDTLMRLKQYFPFTLIDAMGNLSHCEAQIARELRYQSSLELDEGTFQCIKEIPLASTLAIRARQQLVSRLDNYFKNSNSTFLKVSQIINEKVVPLLKMGSLAGLATYRTTNSLFSKTEDEDDDHVESSLPETHSEATRMFMDVLADRCYVYE